MPEPDNEHDPNAVGVWDAERRVQAGYVPAEIAPEVKRDEQAVALWEFRDETGAASACASCSRPPTRGSRSRARDTHEIPLAEATVHGYFSSALPPVLTVDPGDSVRFQSLNAGWRWDPDTEHFERDAELHDGHALTGPDRGARRARRARRSSSAIDEVTPRAWGVTFAHGEPFTWALDGEAWRPTITASPSRSRRSSA